MAPRCSRCGTTDPGAFARSTKNRSGYQGWCRACTRSGPRRQVPATRLEAVHWLRGEIRRRRDAVVEIDRDLGNAIDLVSGWLLVMAGEVMHLPEQLRPG